MTDSQTTARQKHKHRVFLVDDHPIVREGLTRLLNSSRDMTVCGEASDAQQALARLADADADIVTVDISLAGSCGITLIEDIARQFSATRIVALSMHDETVYAERALRAGAHGYVMKSTATGTILGAIRQVLRGDLYVSDAMQDKLLRHFLGSDPGSGDIAENRLTNREFEVFQLLGQGESVRAIAQQLCLSVKTIETHCAHIRGKLGLASSRELLIRASEWVRTTAK